MKEGIHPKLNRISVHCACGSVLDTLCTLEKLSVDICSKCHPFYTGKQKVMDTAGRIDRFMKKYEKKAPSAKKAPRTVTIN